MPLDTLTQKEVGLPATRQRARRPLDDASGGDTLAVLEVRNTLEAPAREPLHRHEYRRPLVSRGAIGDVFTVLGPSGQKVRIDRMLHEAQLTADPLHASREGVQDKIPSGGLAKQCCRIQP
ncbi:hypothetical protein ABZX93_26485 [Streptomyces sp. NPDC006632]|uniref:hypothetical protein n=1 Tax=Streptomyces sp. NPDC006632 TaxID=3157182 RepID=UPI00339F963A